jgi:uncharacterized protein (TIGR02266 family)
LETRRIAELVEAFTPLNRRRVRGDPPLDVHELERWSELRDQIAFEFGHAPPVGPTPQPQHLRVPTHLKVRYGAAGEHAGMLENLSEGGLFVRCGSPLAVGTPLRLEIDGAESGTPLHLEAVVIHARPVVNRDGPAGFGVAFRDVGPEQQAALLRMVEGVLEHSVRRD